MQVRRLGWGGIAVALAGALGTVGVGALRAQDAAPGKKATGKAASKLRDRGGVPLRKALPNAADPLAKAGAGGRPQEVEAPLGSSHYRFKMTAFDGTTLATKYYPSRLGTTAPVILMIHERDRSGKDFEGPIADLKGRGLAEYFQGQGYAILIPDLRGQGTNTRRALAPKDWRQMVDDLQAAYQFLLDRHNRGELNVAKLGVLALGEGANLAAAWLSLPGGAVASEGRVSDISALTLISPMAEGEGFRLSQVMAQLADRVPIQIIVGGRDQTSAGPVRAVLPVVKRAEHNRIDFKDSPLHGYKLMKLEPQVTSDLARFFEGTIKYKASEWEPRYNLNPVTYGEIEVVRNGKPREAEPKKEAEGAKDAANKGEAAK